jgi:folate-binding protein YgfZ
MAAALQPAAIPTSNPDSDSAVQLSALLRGVAVAPLDSVGWIRVTGSDRVRWLNGMVTNAIETLAPGEGCYNFVLNAQGRIQGDLTAFAEADAYLLETGREQVPALMAHLDRFIIMDDVELADITDSRHGVLVAGPQAESILARLGFATGAHSPLHLQSASWNAATIHIVHAHGPVVPRYELWSDSATVAALTASIIAAGGTPILAEAVEYLRILSGTPRYGVDIRNTDAAHDLPQETAQTRALHFSKGCYLGQEIVERIRSRGSVHRTFHGFELTGALPAPGAPLTAESSPRPVGELTSVAAIPLPESAAAPARTIQLALGYVRREALADAQARALTLEYPGGIATPIAMPYPIP